MLESEECLMDNDQTDNDQTQELKAIKPASGEKLFTLEEAKKEIARIECKYYGHDYDIVCSYSAPQHLFCNRCHAHWRVVSE